MARAMKDSGIEWIGEIPQEWEIVRVKNLADAEQENSFIDGDWIESPDISDEGIRYLTTGNVGDGRFKHQGNGFITEETFDRLNCKYAYPGDLVIARLNAPYGRACLLPDDKDKYVLAVDIVILRTTADKNYLCYEMQCNGYQRTVADDAKGTTMKRISRTNLGKIPLVIPSRDEQSRIAAFLDRKCTEIDRIVAETEKTIEEYKALKQSIITEAVTKGVRGKRPMKDSGIEWIGEIPVDWDVSRVGLHYDIILGKMLCTTALSEDYTLEPYFCAANVHFDGVAKDGLKEMWFSSTEKKDYLVRQGDLLIVEGGAGAGGCGIVEEIPFPVYIQNSIMITRNYNGNDNRFLRYLIEFLVKQGYVDIVCNKATIPHFTKDKLANVPYPVLSMAEVSEISDYLDSKCTEIDRLIAAKQQLLTELETYKKSLIYEYVTGKKEVPECR